jgi:5-formyltetrahydrofolate cyclo-ligase
MHKTEARTYFREQRSILSEEWAAQSSAAIADLFFRAYAGMLQPGTHLHLFLPIIKQKEVDTGYILRALQQQYPDVKIVLSACAMEECTMQHFLYDPAVRMVENRYGVPEPVEGTPVQTAAIDLVLVPLLAVDQKGNRVGYGKGYYDRFLADCRPDCQKIGLSFFEPVDTILAEPFDVPVDACITPYGIHHFSS